MTRKDFELIAATLKAVQTHNATLARLARDCTSCSADYRAADQAFTDALRALPDDRMPRTPRAEPYSEAPRVRQ